MRQDQPSDVVQVETGSDYSLILRRIYYLIIFFGFILRVVVSMSAWGMKHPDEIFQSLEMAHVLVYGYGFVPPEFQSMNMTYPSYAASRSWLFPMIFAFFMRLGEWLGLDYLTQTLPMIKFYMAIHATLLIPAVYKLTHQVTKDEFAATLAAFFIAFWFRIVEYTVRTFTNTYFLPLIFYGIYRVLHLLEQKDKSNVLDYIEIGFLLGISTYIRIDMGIIIFSFFVVYFKIADILTYLKIGISSFIFWIWGAWIDYNQYNNVKFFSVPINWFTFNIIKGYSKLFGVNPVYSYFTNFIVGDMLFPWFLIMLIWPLVHLVRPSLREHSILNTSLGTSYNRLLLATAISWIIYSNAWPVVSFANGFRLYFPESHKELRFMIGGLVLFLITTAVLCRLLLSQIPATLDGMSRPQQDTFFINEPFLIRSRNYLLILILITFMLTSLVGAQVRTTGDPFEDINRSLVYVGSHANPDRIYIAEVWYVTGYYSYSHVPESTQFIFVPFHNDGDAGNIRKMKNVIPNQPENSYFIIPWYGYQAFEGLRDLLTTSGWTLVYHNGNVDTWYSNT